MVTVTEADVKVRYLEDWPAGVVAAAVTKLCADAETFIQSKVGTGGTFPLTTAAGVQLSVDLVFNWIERGRQAHRDTDAPLPPAWPREMQERFETILQESAGQELVDTIDFSVS